MDCCSADCGSADWDNVDCDSAGWSAADLSSVVSFSRGNCFNSLGRGIIFRVYCCGE